MKIQCSIQINAPVEKVFSAFTDLNIIKDTIGGIIDLEVLEGTPRIEMGTKWKETRMMFGKEATEEMWVTGTVPNKQYVVEAESHGTHYISTYIFEEKDGGTEVRLSFEGKALTIASRLMSVMMIFFAGTTKKLFLQDMEDLKQHIESS